ncbi:MAG: hypothetical protein K6C13_03910 [Oscillospiraceae bacterium]|nr:hypothetical protein [Oscillospiraceae bacterium]
MSDSRFRKLNFGVAGDSITAGEQWSYHVYRELGMSGHYNCAVGSSVWYKRRCTVNGTVIETQDYNSADFKGISGGWEPTTDINEMQMRLNNCAVVHIQKYIYDVKSGEIPAPDIFAFSYGTNDDAQFIGSAEFALLGKDSDINNTFTEAGAMRWCIQSITAEFPDVRVFVCTPIQTGDPAHNKKLELQIESMKTLCGGMSVQLIDVFHGCGICEKFENAGEKGRYLRDGLHPDAPGQQLMGRFIAKEIRNNYF